MTCTYGHREMHVCRWFVCFYVFLCDLFEINEKNWFGNSCAIKNSTYNIYIGTYIQINACLDFHTLLSALSIDAFSQMHTQRLFLQKQLIYCIYLYSILATKRHCGGCPFNISFSLLCNIAANINTKLFPNKILQKQLIKKQQQEIWA